MSSASTADRPSGVAAGAEADRDVVAGGPIVAPRSAAAGALAAECDPFRWRGLGVPRTAAPYAPPAATSAPGDRYPWRGLRAPIVVAPTTRAETGDRSTPAAAATREPTTGPTTAPVLVIGLGNPILGDDGVGWRVADLVEARLGADAGDVRVERAALGGLALMERLVGARRAILVDAMETGSVPVGTVRCLSLAEVGCREAAHLDSAHDAPLTVAIAAGRALGADLPADVSVVAVEALHVDTFSDDLSPAVAAAVPAAVAAVLHLLDA
jgi:hydrogenase maturation protease